MSRIGAISRASCCVVMLFACALDEGDGYLIGRRCEPEAVGSCGDGSVCLPHAYSSGSPTDFRCRDRASFEPISGREPPIAYCGEKLGCPEGLVCNADRIRDRDGDIRRTVCQFPNGIAPPLSDR